jgi:hypothetical protein
MKTKTAVFYTIIFFGLFFFGLSLIISFSTNLTLSQFFRAQTDEKPTQQVSNTCTDIEKLPDLDKSTDRHLNKLFEYQEVCDSLAVSRMMIFTDMPKDAADADAKASKVAATLIEFATYKVQPLVIIEPVTEWGLVDFSEFNTGFYDQWLEQYFAKLKSLGVNDEMMGIWVPFPEANLPYWNRANAQPADFGNVVNRYLRILKRHFPQAKASVLLNSATYETTDFNWERGEYISLIPYVSTLDSSLINSFGIQGFPWKSEATSPNPTKLYDARQYINSRLAMEAAAYLNVKEIWFNTGTFSKKFTLDSANTVYEDAAIRSELLSNTIDEALVVKNKGYSIWINIFAEDKSDVTEATDWSYWQDYKDSDNPHRYTFKDFMRKAFTQQIGLSLFDTTKEDVPVVDTPAE